MRNESIRDEKNGGKTVIAVKWSAIKKIPISCVDCIYFATRPDPFDGWRDFCDLNRKTIEDPDERAEHCLLIEVE